MTEEEVIDLLKKRLAIRVSDESHYENLRIRIQLTLDGEVISEEYFDIESG